VSAIEDRLRNAYQRGAETIHAESLRPSVLPELEPCGPAKRRRRHRRLGGPRLGALRLPAPLAVPLAAALAVAVIAIATVAVPQLIPAMRHGARGPAAPGAMSTPSPFLIVLRSGSAGGQVLSAATGRIVARVPAPGGGGTWLEGAAAGPGGKRFLLIATTPGACGSRFYLLTLSGAGAVASLRPYSVPNSSAQPGVSEPSGTLAVSADGSTVAYVGYPCPGVLAGDKTITVVRDGAARTWTTPTFPSGLSLSANGRLLGYIDVPGSAASSDDAWVLPTDAAPGSLGQHAHVVFAGSPRGGTQALSTVFGPGGSTMYVLSGVSASTEQFLSYGVSAYALSADGSAGSEPRILHTWRYRGSSAATTGFIASGDQALIWGLHGTAIDQLNLVSGVATSYRWLRLSNVRPVAGIAW
jgi:hypothetical protein